MDDQKIRKFTTLALLTALVILLQAYLANILTFWGLSLSLVLVPIVVGACLFGPLEGAWLGFAFGLTVLIAHQADGFMQWNLIGTIVLVLTKGTAAGFVAGVIYRALVKKNQRTAIFLAATFAPIVNTAIFVTGCLVFYPNKIGEILSIIVLINFLIELAINIVLSPSVMFLVKSWKKIR